MLVETNCTGCGTSVRKTSLIRVHRWQELVQRIKHACHGKQATIAVTLPCVASERHQLDETDLDAKPGR
jgi:hypothetical protein